MSPTDNKALVRAFFDAANAQDMQGFLSLIADDCVIHSPVPGTTNGVDGFQALLGVLLAGVPDQRVEVHDLVAEGDRVVARHTHRGTHAGELLGVPPTGNRVEIAGIEEFRIADGKIAEFWHMDDLLSLMQQIGAVAGDE
jgi:steroid delta-isomerase-like uncharacterized protein